MTSSEETITEMPPRGSGGVEVEGGRQYPAPYASHEIIVSSSEEFLKALNTFHSLFGTKLMVPVIGGKDLDLHVLYVEVTKRGGFEKVVVEKKWRDVGTAFNLSPTATSASYVLRKHYLSLLYHFEQVHFFRLQGPLFSPSVGLRVRKRSSTCSRPTERSSDHNVSSDNQSMQMQKYQISEKRTSNYSDLQTGESTCYRHVVGTIDGKFDYGYLVSVKLGSETLRGVLYHVPEPTSTPCSAQISTAIVPYNPTPQSRRRRKRRRRYEKDPGRPKPNRSGYNFFFSEKHSKLKIMYPNREREFTKMIGESWNKLNDEERMVYQEISVKDKERYKRELQEYKEKVMGAQQLEVGRSSR